MRTRPFRWMRLAALLSVLAGAAVLHRWSHTGDPRFYAFLRTPVGQAAANVFGWWRSPLEKPSPTKPDHRLTATERRVQADIQAGLTSRIADERIEVTYRDIAFRLEFPEKPLYLHPPFAILSDAPPDEVARLVEILVETHAQFHPLYQPLFTQAYRRDLIHVLYFADPAEYDTYQRVNADGLDGTAGFYSPAVNRLVLFRHDPSTSSDPIWAALQTQYTIRHEATHLFMVAYGVHSFHHIENEWLIEGLACFAETSRPGGVDPRRRYLLQQAAGAEALIPLGELVNHRDQRARLLAYTAAELAYSQAWSLVHFLMQPPYRDGFFDYIQYIRDPAHFHAVRSEDRLTLLARFVDQRPEELEAAWMDHLRRL